MLHTLTSLPRLPSIRYRYEHSTACPESRVQAAIEAISTSSYADSQRAPRKKASEPTRSSSWKQISPFGYVPHTYSTSYSLASSSGVDGKFLHRYPGFGGATIPNQAPNGYDSPGGSCQRKRAS